MSASVRDHELPLGAASEPGAPIEVGGLRWERSRSGSRVSVDVEGESVWFESEDAELLPCWEAFGSALLVPSLAAGQPLALRGQVCGEWLRNTTYLLRTLAEWWDYPMLLPQADSVAPVDPTARVRRLLPSAREAALCFTCGVDSFFTLLERRPTPRVLVLALGYDVALDDDERAADLERRVRSVAAARHCRAVVIRTNLRQHHLVSDVSWPHMHGGAMAALGHVLSGQVGTLVISASYAYSHDLPWGSHWRIDRRWSSSRLRVDHFGQSHTRYDKLARLAHEPLVQEHLQVCWKHGTPMGNCSECAKCGATMLMLQHLGVLDRFDTFADELPDPEPLLDMNRSFYRVALERMVSDGRLDERWEAALGAHLANTQPTSPTPLARRAADLLRRP